MARRYYISDYMADLKDYSWLGAIPSSLKVHDALIDDSGDIDNSRNYMQYGNETIFYREERIHGTRYIVYFSPRLRSRRIESFFAQLSERETGLKELGKTRFKTQQDLIGSVESALKGFRRLIDVQYDKKKLSFSYSLRHKAIQRRNNRLGYTVLITNTLFPATEILRMYWQKDVVEKAFSHVKPHLEPFFVRKEEGTRARLFLTILAYTLAAIITERCNITYESAMKTMAGICEVIYSNGSHAHVEYTKDQRELLEKLKIDL
ncbi:MAG: IS1634 family transposase [Thermoplasmata archaeon]